MKHRRILFWSITVALGGFLFGFDTAVISGAEQDIQKIWDLNSVQHGFTVSIALIGTVVGALFGGIPSDRIGRKMTLFWIAVLYLVSALGLPSTHLLGTGTPMCAGCGGLGALHEIYDILGEKSVFVNAAGCMTLLSVYPFTPFRGSWLYTAMASAPAGAPTRASSPTWRSGATNGWIFPAPS